MSMNTFHEPLLEQCVRTPLTRPAGTLSPRPTRGEGRGEGCSFRFMAGEQVRKEQAAFHEPWRAGGRLLGVVIALAVASAIQAGEVQPLHKLSRAEQEAKIRSDFKHVQTYRAGLQSVLTFVNSQPELFPVSRRKETRLLLREEKEVVWSAWQRLLDYVLALDSLEQAHSRHLLLKGELKEESFLTGYAAFLAQYRFALEFIDRAENNPELDKVLNEPVPEIGLPKGTYAKLKFEFLNIRQASAFAARETLLKTFLGKRSPAARALIAADSARVWQMGKGKGEVLTARNALKVMENAGQKAWHPVQAGVSEWMGDTKVYRPGRSLISQEQIRQLVAKLEPGDILLERREWFLSNIGLPGYWPHAALYIGTPGERRAYFTEADVQAWVRAQGQADGDFEALLRARYPKAHTTSLRPQEHDHPPRVLEAMSEGVSFTTIEHSADCDALAVLRPRLPKREKAAAVLRAFHYAGRPYDFEFDFSTDAELVCTELVYKAYEPANGMRGLKFSLVEMLGRKVTPANVMARQFDEQCGTAEQQTDLILFLDGREREKTAASASLADFRASWKRPKWHIVTQELTNRR